MALCPFMFHKLNFGIKIKKTPHLELEPPVFQCDRFIQICLLLLPPSSEVVMTTSFQNPENVFNCVKPATPHEQNVLTCTWFEVAANKNHTIFLGRVCLFYVFLHFRGQSAKKACLRFAIFNIREKLQTIFEIEFKKIWSDWTKIALEKNLFRNKKFADTILCFIC